MRCNKIVSWDINASIIYCMCPMVFVSNFTSILIAVKKNLIKKLHLIKVSSNQLSLIKKLPNMNFQDNFDKLDCSSTPAPRGCASCNLSSPSPIWSLRILNRSQYTLFIWEIKRNNSSCKHLFGYFSILPPQISPNGLRYGGLAHRI